MIRLSPIVKTQSPQTSPSSIYFPVPSARMDLESAAYSSTDHSTSVWNAYDSIKATVADAELDMPPPPICRQALPFKPHVPSPLRPETSATGVILANF